MSPLDLPGLDDDSTHSSHIVELIRRRRRGQGWTTAHQHRRTLRPSRGGWSAAPSMLSSQPAGAMPSNIQARRHGYLLGNSPLFTALRMLASLRCSTARLGELAGQEPTSQ
ncbi:hypothetical protein DPSP01_009660 [Paraphaeosphaeria sporulosa]